MSHGPHKTSVHGIRIGGAVMDASAAGSKAPRLKVCHVISGDSWAGAEVQVADLVEALVRQNNFHLSAIVLNEGRLAKELRSAGVEVCVIPETSNNFLRILTRAERFVRSQGPHVLHSHRYKENFLALLLAGRCRVPVTIRTQHGLSEPFKGIKGLRHSAAQWLDRSCGRWWSDAVISVSAEMMPALQNIYGSRTVLVRNGIDTGRVRSALTREEAKRKLLLPEDAPLCGLVGRLEPIKRPELFLEMAAVLGRRFPTARFVVAGKGRMEEELKLQASALGLCERLQFLGHRDDAFDVLRALDVLVICSDHEGMPMVLLEALWLEVPVVGRSVGGIREVLGENQCGVVVDSSRPDDLASACHRMIEDGELRERLRRAAVQRVAEQFSLERSADEVAGQYIRLAKMKRLELA